MDISMPTQTPTPAGADGRTDVEVYYEPGRRPFKLPAASLTKRQIIEDAANQKVYIDPTAELDYAYPDGGHGTVCGDPLPIHAGTMFTSKGSVSL